MLIHFRWVIRKNEVCAEDVRFFATTQEFPMLEAKRILEDKEGPILQVDQGYGWVDVPTVVEYRKN